MRNTNSRYKHRHGDIVSIPSPNPRRPNARILVVCVFIDERRFPYRNIEKTGIHYMRGQWYGNNPTNVQSHGKIKGIQHDLYNKGAYKIGNVFSRKDRNKKFY